MCQPYSPEFLNEVKKLVIEVGEILGNDELAKIVDIKSLNENIAYLESIIYPKLELYDRYSEVLLGVGCLYTAKKEYDKAEQYYLSIKKEYNLELYAFAQLNLGLLFYEQKQQYKQAEKYWSGIKEDSLKAYTYAQLYLGRLFYEQNKNYEQAKKYWLSIEKDDDKRVSAFAKLYLGRLSYEQEKNEEQAEKYWLDIHKEDNSEIYAYAQLHLGRLFYNREQYTKAEEYWENIVQNKYDTITYAYALLYLGRLFYEQNQYPKAEEYWKKVEEKDNPESYVSAQFSLNLMYKQKKEYKSFYIHFAKCLNYTNHMYYNDVLDIILQSLIKQVISIEDISVYFNGIREEYIRVIFEKLKNLGNKEYQKKLLKLLQYYLTIRKELLVVKELSTVKGEDEVIVSNEHYFAHYTEASTAIHFVQKEDRGEHWNFRLSEASQLNDPKEGKVLFDYIDDNLSKKEQTEIAVFVASFSFNHDSLNQFRLYGKKQNQEATGVSVLFKPDFFSTAHNILNLNIPNKLPTWGNASLGNEFDNNIENTRLPLYRCVYFDPKSTIQSNEEIPYIRIACCDERTFYMQNDKNMNELERYNKRIKQIENNVLKQLKNIKNIVGKILQSSPKDEMIELIKIILLPLSYLIKHAAYREEQECRIIQCCSFNDERIDKTGFKDAKSYLPYTYPITENTIKRVYLSEGAKNYKKIFQMLGLKEKNVRISSNPFRIVSEK